MKTLLLATAVGAALLLAAGVLQAQTQAQAEAGAAAHAVLTPLADDLA